jgi:hypothetical protein
MARPPKDNAESRRHLLSFRLTPRELALLNARLNESGLNRSDFLRFVALKSRLLVRSVTTADPALIAELNRIGVNLNQLTRTANGIGKVPPDLDRLCRKIEQIVTKAAGKDIES